MVSDLLVSVHEWEVREEVDGEAGPGVVSRPLDDLCIDIWMSMMIIYLRTQMTKR